MAELIIKFKDLAGGKVEIISQPSNETLLNKINSGNSVTAAEAYALRAMRSIREDAKHQGQLIAPVPRVGR